MATWQVSNHREQQSLMLPTTCYNSWNVCSFQLKMCPLCSKNIVKNLFLSNKVGSLTSNSSPSKPPFRPTPLSSLPLSTYIYPLIRVLTVAVSLWIPDHSLEISVGFRLPPSPCCDNFNLPASLKGLPGASGSTICPLTPSWGWESRRVGSGWGWWVKDEAIWSYLWELLSPKFSWLTCGRNTTHQN